MIPACAAIKVLIGHCKDHRDLQCCGDADALFVNDTTRFVLLTPQKHHFVGSYLFWAKKHGRMVRSGKAYGREQNLGTRVKAHATGSCLTTPDQQKQLHLISYVFELVDELMIEPRLDVSESRGMEAFMMDKGPAGYKA